MSINFKNIISYYEIKKTNFLNILFGVFSEFKVRLKNYIISKISKFNRSQNFTKKRYEKIWKGTMIEKWFSPNHGLCLHTYEKRLFYASAGLTKKIHHELIIKEIKDSVPKKVLEVGSGNGVNLRILSSLFKDSFFTGIDQSENGIQFSNKLKIELLPRKYVEPLDHNFDFNTFPLNLNYHVGDAKNLKFPNEEFDFVYTILALEQMKNIQLEVIKELKRVSKKTIVLIEPFPELNRSVIKFLHHNSKQYFNLHHKKIADKNWKIKKFVTNVPTKLTLGYGMLVLEKNN